jgi:hypothetical protein
MTRTMLQIYPEVAYLGRNHLCRCDTELNMIRKLHRSRNGRLLLASLFTFRKCANRVRNDAHGARFRMHYYVRLRAQFASIGDILCSGSDDIYLQTEDIATLDCGIVLPSCPK